MDLSSVDISRGVGRVGCVHVWTYLVSRRRCVVSADLVVPYPQHVPTKRHILVGAYVVSCQGWGVREWGVRGCQG